jgi:hypothetical protein
MRQAKQQYRARNCHCAGPRGGICHDGGVTDEVPTRPEGAGEFWETEPGWVLLGGCDGDSTPFNQLTSMAMLICDEDEYAHVVAAMRASGCPVLDMPGDDDRPCFAEIYVDQVPQDAVKILVELRRLLGRSWPFSDLRTMLAAQPVHVATRDVAELRTALTAAPRLRPYLFHDSRDGLIPVWP